MIDDAAPRAADVVRREPVKPICRCLKRVAQPHQRKRDIRSGDVLHRLAAFLPRWEEDPINIVSFRQGGDPDDYVGQHSHFAFRTQHELAQIGTGG